jgi:hypothetical protein
MDISMANLSDDDDNEYEEDGCLDQMWDKMNEMLQEVLNNLWLCSHPSFEFGFPILLLYINVDSLFEQ